MKLENKETGEIKPAEAREDGIYLYDEITEQWYKYELDLLAKWWEYYEEPKEYWAIDCFSPDGELVSQFGGCSERIIENRKQIGNYFETKEEAEKAVEKLKAWKRLKDKVFRLNHWKEAKLRPNMSCVSITGNIKVDEETRADLNLLFGGEE